jgi:hypothetical protein
MSLAKTIDTVLLPLQKNFYHERNPTNMTSCELKDPVKDHPENQGNLKHLQAQAEDPPTKTIQQKLCSRKTTRDLSQICPFR